MNRNGHLHATITPSRTCVLSSGLAIIIYFGYWFLQPKYVPSGGREEAVGLSSKYQCIVLYHIRSPPSTAEIPNQLSNISMRWSELRTLEWHTNGCTMMTCCFPCISPGFRMHLLCFAYSWDIVSRFLRGGRWFLRSIIAVIARNSRFYWRQHEKFDAWCK